MKLLIEILLHFLSLLSLSIYEAIGEKRVHDDLWCKKYWITLCRDKIKELLRFFSYNCYRADWSVSCMIKIYTGKIIDISRYLFLEMNRRSIRSDIALNKNLDSIKPVNIHFTTRIRLIGKSIFLSKCRYKKPVTKYRNWQWQLSVAESSLPK